MLQFWMHANLIHVTITVGVPTLHMGFDADAMKSIQEGRALVGAIIIIIIPVIIVICLKCHCVFIHLRDPIHALVLLCLVNIMPKFRSHTAMLITLCICLFQV